MEVPEPACPAPPAREQPPPTPGHPGAPGGQASSRLTLGPVILPPEQGLAPAVFLKALPIPLYHTMPPGGLQPRAPVVTGSLDRGSVPFILGPLLRPEGPGPAQVGKPAAPALTVNIVGALPVLSPGLGPPLGSPGKLRNAGKHLCPHCGRDCLKPSVLEKHIRSHTGERPFPCATCGIAFKTQSNLYKHRRTQTHLNNSRLSSESEGGGGGLLEEGDKAGETTRPEGSGESRSQRLDESASEGPLSPGAGVFLVAKNLDVKTDAAPCPGSASANRETPGDSALTVPPGLPVAGSQPWRKLLEQKSPAGGKPSLLQRQQATSSEKPWEAKAAEGRLRKCESTDSGYLSRSDSAEQPPAPPSPLHSLSEHSAESEGEVGPALGSARPAGLELEKRRLEERIARLISHNQAVVDDAQLDTVRPRKTGLCKQGSIDLPLPYTYKDSFHFDIRAPEPGRRRAALGAARSTWTPPDTARPLFFHSVPTQLSSTVECVPVTRSNSLPFVEGCRTWREPLGTRDACPRTQKPLSPRLTPTRLGCRSGLTWAEVASGHPRALVRQAAVEDLPWTSPGEAPGPTEDQDGKRTAPGEGAAGKGRGASKKCGQRRLKLFSQEKWQVYGKETFKRIYQKTKASPQAGKRAREVRGGSGTELDLPPQEKAAAVDDPGNISGGARPEPWGSLQATEASLVPEPPKQRETEAREGDSDQPRVDRAVSSPTLSDRDVPYLGSKNSLLPPNGRQELGQQPPPAPATFKGDNLEAPRQSLPDPELEGGTQGGGGVKETCAWAQTVLVQPSGGPKEDLFPSEKKKLKVEVPGSWEPPEPVGAEAPGGSAQATSQEQDIDLGEHQRTRQAGEPLESSGASSGVASVVPKQIGLKDQVSLWHSATMAPGHQTPPTSQPQAPGVLTTAADNAFSPKYLLRLPQTEPPSPLPVPQGPGQGQGILCRTRQPEEEVSFVKSGPGTSLSPGPASGAPRETTSCPPTPTCEAPTVQVREGETHVIHHLCMGGTLPRARPSGAVSSPWVPSWESGGVLEDPLSGPLAGLSPCCPLQPGSFIRAQPRPQAVSPSWPELALSSHSGTPRSCRAQSPFPSLKAEPRLTWCCLRRSVPLPMEQKGKLASMYSALHCPGGSLQDEGPDALPSNNRGWARMRPGEGRPAQISKLSYPIVPGVMSQDPVSEPEGKKGLPRRRGKMSRGSGKQRKLRITAKRYKGSFLQSRVQLRASRLHKPTWAPRRSCHLPPLEGLDWAGPSGRTLGKASSEMAGLNPQDEPPCATSESSLCCENKGKKEDDCRQISGPFSPNASSRTVREIDKLTVKTVSPSARERGDCSPHNTAAGSGSPPPPDTGLAVANNNTAPQSKGLDAGLLETLPLSSQDQVSADPERCLFSDAPEPSACGSKGPFSHQDSAAMCISLEAKAGPAATVGIHSAEPREHSWAAGETRAQSSPGSKAMAEGTSQALLPGTLSAAQNISGSVPSGSTGKSHLEIAASGPSSSSSHQEEGRHKLFFPSRVQSGCGEMATPCPPLGSDGEKCQLSGPIIPKGSVDPPQPRQPTESPEAPSKSVKKKSLEGMRKQTCVEFSDASSDDEDRLVIEI
ncbi:zinc finger protein 831 [Otolemur garnettii]|uniref:Zinc finger protein 831 n=1 Tax=Otolemur garnettii TaxID=30611 RepID=H0XJ25_OTOGA|nr:zinc finger protein 831 [Otolemur garnettii]